MPERGGLLRRGALAPHPPRAHRRPGRPGRRVARQGSPLTRIGIITQARMTSTRLPGKVLIPAGGRSMLDHHIDRLAAADLPIVLATTTNAADDPLAALGHARGIDVFRGSETDVLSRFSGAASSAELDVVVRVTSDCPLIDPAVVLEGVRRFIALDDPHAHVSNVLQRTYPRGFDFEVFSAAALADADRNATEPAEREHVTPYLYAGGSPRANIHSITQDVDASHYRVTLDTPEDLTVIRRLIEEHGAASLDATGIVAVLDAHPDLAAVNAHVEQKKLGE
ncbi:cytidylyltransferase domain-containing protein [Microbacterium sp.]|uniref:cytidylyltransferase domain-containing protein n=1 Tax=Microbacterium sp. TaxID=51671 RepID=UPI0035676F40